LNPHRLQRGGFGVLEVKENTMANPAPKTTKARKDWYAETTATILAELQNLKDNPSMWEKPWDGLWKFGLPLRNTDESFTGLNVWLLALAGQDKGYTDPRWYTYNQAMEVIGGYKKDGRWWNWAGEGDDPKHGVRKGEHGSPAIRVSRTPIYADAHTGKRVWPPKRFAPKEQREAWKARLASGGVVQQGAYTSILSYTVFNAEQIDGLPKMATKEIDPAEKYAQAEALVDILGVEVKHLDGCDSAAYLPTEDRVVMPATGQFRTVEDYVATKMHEVIHWTGSPKRLNRTKGLQGSDEYAFEELVAELGSAFLCAHLGIEGKLQHPEYLAAWIKRLQADEKAIIRAASLASKAVDFILAGGHVARDTNEQGSASSRAA